MIYGFTGHRPNKLGGYGDQAMSQIDNLAMRWLADNRPTLANIGMAIGFDMSVARACSNLGVPFVAYVPFVGQENAWPEVQRKSYTYLLGRASAVKVITDGGFSPAVMQRRNEAIVDDSDSLIALWNGKPDGGTYNCLRYAEKKGVPIINLWGWRP